MKVNPAIDLQGGRSVRLLRGDFKRETLIAARPLDQALAWQAAGINRLHLVDLDGARLGRPENRAQVMAIRDRFSGMIELGGGIRDLATVADYLAAGIDRVILGSAALTNPALVTAALARYGAKRVVVGVDGENGLVKTAGWLKQSRVPMATLINQLAGEGVRTFIVTDVSRDGAMQGANLPLLRDLQDRFSATRIVASGGVRNAGDLRALAAAGIQEAVVGRALFNGDLTVAEVREVNGDVG